MAIYVLCLFRGTRDVVIKQIKSFASMPNVDLCGSASVGHSSSWQNKIYIYTCNGYFFISVWHLVSSKLNMTEHFGNNLNNFVLNTAATIFVSLWLILLLF